MFFRHSKYPVIFFIKKYHSTLIMLYDFFLDLYIIELTYIVLIRDVQGG